MMWSAFWLMIGLSTGAGPQASDPVQVQVELHAYEDGVATFRRPITRDQAERLVRQGAYRARSEQFVHAGAIFDGHYHFEYALTADVVEKIERAPGRWVGRPLQVSLMRGPRGRYRVVSIEANP
ncbi:MAG TPA: hypothetical protein RMG48_18350 [Myxococcales bacterium LLY-WYZ-16_1]|jgi:hypothetical protein|nr:hypothetical protein [Myxococcales bacterium LLY-WYZ-16_1]